MLQFILKWFLFFVNSWCYDSWWRFWFFIVFHRWLFNDSLFFSRCFGNRNSTSFIIQTIQNKAVYFRFPVEMAPYNLIHLLRILRLFSAMFHWLVMEYLETFLTSLFVQYFFLKQSMLIKQFYPQLIITEIRLKSKLGISWTIPK